MIGSEKPNGIVEGGIVSMARAISVRKGAIRDYYNTGDLKRDLTECL